MVAADAAGAVVIGASAISPRSTRRASAALHPVFALAPLPLLRPRPFTGSEEEIFFDSVLARVQVIVAPARRIELRVRAPLHDLPCSIT